AGVREIVDATDWLDLLASMYPDTYRAIQNELKRSLDDNPNWDGITDPKAKAALTAYLRANHADHAKAIMTQRWKTSNDEDFFLLEDAELRHYFGELIGELARSHWQDVQSLPARFGKVRGAVPKMPADWTVDPLKLACILRTSDAAQVDSRRADPLHTPFRQPQGESKNHWLFQERMLMPHPKDGRLVYTSTRDFTIDQASAWWLAFDTIQMIDGELRKVDAILADLRRPRLDVRSVAGADTPTRLSEYIRATDWVPIDARPVINDTEGVIAKLGGQALYGHRQGHVVLRELLANAVDATRLRAAEDPQSVIQPVRVTVTQDSDGRFVVEVADQGIGMTVEEVVNFLCAFGTSGWNSYATRTEHPGALAAGYRSTGQFGIGFYSVFMLADEVTVQSRSTNVGPTETAILHFSNGLHERPVLRVANSRNDWRREPGTSISFVLRNGAQGISELVSSFDPITDLSDLGRVLTGQTRRAALLCGMQILVQCLGGAEYEATSVVPWREMDPGILFDQLYFPDTQYSQSAEYARWRRNFERYSRPVCGENGETIGRLSLNLDPEQRPHAYRGRTPGRIYCGGFIANEVHDIGGVLLAEPDTAARSSTRAGLSLREGRRWFEEQVELLGGELANISDRLTVATWAINMGVPLEDQPFVLGKGGPLTPAAFQEWALDRDRIEIVDLIGNTADYGDGTLVFLDASNDALVRLGDDMVSCPSTEDFDLIRFIEGPIGGELEFADEFFCTGESIQEWWIDSATSVAGEVVRRAAAAWGVSVIDLLRASWHCEQSWEEDSGLEILSVRGEKLRVSGLALVRPTANSPVAAPSV
ncbi:HD domain-containing protein, partial [Oryzihumus leptocrescens]